MNTIELEPFYRGDDHALLVELIDENDDPVFIQEGTKFQATMKRSPEQSDSQAAVKVDADHIAENDAENGRVYIVLPSEQTRNLQPTEYFIDVQRVSPEGSVSTLFIGRVRVLADVTHRRPE